MVFYMLILLKFRKFKYFITFNSYRKIELYHIIKNKNQIFKLHHAFVRI